MYTDRGVDDDDGTDDDVEDACVPAPYAHTRFGPYIMQSLFNAFNEVLMRCGGRTNATNTSRTHANCARYHADHASRMGRVHSIA